MSKLSWFVFLAACSSSTPNNTPKIVVTPDAGVAVVAPPKPVEKPVSVEAPKPVIVAPIAIPTKYDELLVLGRELSGKGEHERAREMFLAAAKQNAKSSTPHVELARSYIATNERGNAIKHANKAVKLAPESSQAYNTLGRAELLRFNYDNAIVAFRQATELDAKNVWAWNNLGLCYLEQKQYDDAVVALETAVAIDGKAEGYMWNNLGTAYEQLDRLDDARDAFEKGGKSGSVAAAASRKRLEGVDTVAVVKKAPKSTEYPIKADDPATPVVAPPVEEPKVEPKVEPTKPTEGMI